MAEPIQRTAGITGLGMSFPERRLTNADLEKMVDTSDEWIIERTGIRERRIADKGVPASHHGAEAALAALADADLTPDDVDLILVPTVTPDMMFPSTACIIQDRIGAGNAWGFDISAACSGFVFALEVARTHILAGTARRVLVIGTEIMNSIVDYADRNVCILFGDGAGAVVVEEVDPAEGGIIGSICRVDGTGGKYLNQKAGGSLNPASHETVDAGMHYIYQEGRDVYKFAVRGMANVALEVVEKHGFAREDVSLMVPHQANIRIIEAAQKRLRLTDAQVAVTIDRFGNTTSASIPSALQVAREEGRVKKGDLIVLVSFGAGFTWGANLLRWCRD